MLSPPKAALIQNKKLIVLNQYRVVCSQLQIFNK